MVFKDEKTWNLISDNKFELETVKKSKNELEEIIEEIAGIKISLFIIFDERQNKVARLEEISNAPNEGSSSGNLAEEVQPMMPPEIKEELTESSMAPVSTEGNWEELSSEDNFDSDPELKGLKKIFKDIKINKVSRVKK